MLMGRADRIVKIGEKRVSLTTIERELEASDEVCEARALSLGDGTRARLAVVAVPTEAGAALLSTSGKRALNQRLRTRLLSQVERLALPRRWRYVRALPVNSLGKCTESLLAALFRPYLPEPRWLAGDGPDAALEIDLRAEMIVFDGHFPERAMLPGIAQVDWAIEFARMRYELPARFVRLDALKFQRAAEPGITLTLKLQWQPERGTLNFTWDSASGKHSSGRALFADNDAI
jgi:hypothetical protein